MFACFGYLLLGLPLTVVIYCAYLSFVDIDLYHHLALICILYSILVIDLISDEIFRKDFNLLLIMAGGGAGRTLIYIFMGIVLLTGPMHDIYHNIIFLVNKIHIHNTTTSTGAHKSVEFKKHLFKIIESHVEEHLFGAVKPFCDVADNWLSFSSNSPQQERICAVRGGANNPPVVPIDQGIDEFLRSLFHFSFYYAVQRTAAIFCLIICSFKLYYKNQMYQTNILHRNFCITQILRQQEREPTETKEDQGREPFSEEMPEDETPQRVFKTTLPLTKLEDKIYIYVDKYRYLRSEIFHVIENFLTFFWILFLFVSIAYLDFTIVAIIQKNYPEHVIKGQDMKLIRVSIVGCYLFMTLVFIFLEPIGKRVYYRQLEKYYPKVAERRARILMLTIGLQRKSFIEINRLNIHLRFNKTGTVWTAIKTFFEDTSLADCLGRPSGLFCSICETEAFFPKRAQRCSTYSCPCVYCMACYEQIRFICLYCNKKYDETMVVLIQPQNR